MQVLKGAGKTICQDGSVCSLSFLSNKQEKKADYR